MIILRIGERLVLAVGILLGSACCCCAFAGQTITVEGWVYPTYPKTAAELYADPVLGRISCPALSQFNNLAGETQGLILKNLKQKSPKQWELGLRSGIFFWNGEEVNALHLVEFLQSHLGDIILRKYPLLSQRPAFEAKRVAADVVTVDFDSDLVIGPLVLNEEPFYRTATDPKFGAPFECAGRFWPEKTSEADSSEYTLRRTPGYAGQTEALRFAKQGSSTGKGALVRFEWPSKFDHRRVVAGEYKKGCHTILLPYFTALAWNESDSSWTEKHRHELSALLPLSELVRLGTAFTGSASPWPFPFDTDAPRVTAPKRVHHTSKRDYPSFTMAPSSFPIRYVLVESMKTFGVPIAEGTTPHTASLVGFRVDASGHDLLPLFHSEARGSILGPIPHSAELDAALQHYLIQSSRAPKGAPKARKKLYAAFSKILPVTTLMQHSICLSSQALPGIAARGDDPDWFRKLIL